ncbi:MAG TPA: phosphoribosyltransferase family protein [Oligoflexia bacterium]|nr:phosphoribosyltransferase family protein [Oligoflexia bacterium]HMP48496.1 phosphoribosyltransferase family protein [Oligoflexia bacterium]
MSDKYSLLFTKEEIKAHTERVGLEIDSWITEEKNRTGKPVIALCILRGAIFFFSDLLRSIPQDVQAEFCKLQTYDGNNNPIPDDKLPPIEISRDLSGHSVLIVDDICDSGRVLSVLTNHLRNKGVSSIKSAVMVYRDTNRSQFTPDYFAFKLTSEEWLVGMGFDDNNTFRNLPEIYAIRSKD